MLCCAIAAIGLAGAWMAHRLRLIGGIALIAAVAAVAVAGGSLLWDHGSHGPAKLADGRAPPDGVSLCSGARLPQRPYPLL